MFKRLNAIVALLIVGSMVLAACGGASSGGGTIKIASQSPLSGGQSVLGVDIKNGAELALEQLGGPLRDMGFTLQLAPYDDQANPDTGVANAKQIVADPDVLCFVGHLNSGVAIPSSEEYHSAGLAMVSPANTNVNITDRGYAEVNRIVGRDDVQGFVDGEFAYGQGWTTAYVVHDKTAYGQGVAEFFQQRFESEGGSVVDFQGTEEKANFDALITPILAASPDVVFFGGIYDQAGVFFKQAREKGYVGAFLGPDGMDSSTLVELAGPALLDGGGMYYTAVAGPAEKYPDTAKFIADFEAKYGAKPQPFSAQGYDSMGICLTAIKNAIDANGGSLPTRAQVAEAVRNIKDYKGITNGAINFNSKGDIVPTARYFILHVDSADPAAWGNNSIFDTLDIAPPE